MKKAKYKNDLLYIQFTYDPVMVTKIKQLPYGRKWNPKIKTWTCPISLKAIQHLESLDFELDKSILDWKKALFKETEEGYEAIEPENLKKKLYPFQKEGIGFLQKKNGKALLGDEMGLGKTVQALGYLANNNHLFPALVVCPASLKGNWKKECKNWTSLSSHIINGQKKYSLPNSNLLIINYDIVSSWQTSLRNIKTIILDESHYIKNNKAKRTKATRKLAKTCNHIIALSGTPIINRPIEFFTILNLIAPKTFPSYWNYAQRYCGAKYNGFGWDFTGASHIDELYELINKRIMLRRTKKKVLTELPDKQETILPLDLNGNEKIYEQVLDEVYDSWEEGQSHMKELAAIEKLRQAAVKAKFSKVEKWIDDFLESDNKLVLFCIHHKTIDKIKKRYKSKAIVLDGRTPMKERQEAVRKFQEEDKIKLFIGNIQAAGTGITLTAANNVAFIELPWTSGELKQASDRCHRIGQKNSVNIYYLIASETLEEEMIKLLSKKANIVSKVLDGKKQDESFQDIKVELIKKLKKRRG